MPTLPLAVVGPQPSRVSVSTPGTRSWASGRAPHLTLRLCKAVGLSQQGGSCRLGEGTMVFWALTGVVSRCGVTRGQSTLSLRCTLAFLSSHLRGRGPPLSRVSVPLTANQPSPETIGATSSHEAGAPNPELPVGTAVLVSSTPSTHSHISYRFLVKSNSKVLPNCWFGVDIQSRLIPLVVRGPGCCLKRGGGGPGHPRGPVKAGPASSDGEERVL